jgi:hypothetical protein
MLNELITGTNLPLPFSDPLVGPGVARRQVGIAGNITQ